MILINPKSERLGIFSGYVPVNVPLGIGYISAHLMKQDIPVTIVDEEIEILSEARIDDIIKNEPKPLIVGLTSVTAGIARAMDLARLIKEKYPDSYIVMGGIHPTVMPEEPLMKSPTDFVVLGEGEITITELINAIRNGRDCESVDGIAYRKNGEIIKTNKGKLLDPKEIPDFPYHLFDPHIDRYDLDLISSTRGCPFDCIFCSQRAITGKGVRYLEIPQVIKQLQTLADRYHSKHVTFVDDNFVIRKSRVLEMCDQIVEHGLHKKIVFDCQARGDAMNHEVLTALKRANFSAIHFGIEVASDRLMKFICKGETLEEIRKGVRLAKEYGFAVSGTFILGFPTETQEERKAAYRLATELNLDSVRFNNATPYPGTKLYDMVKDDERFHPGERWEGMNACLTLVDSPFNLSSLVYVPETTTESKLRRDILRYNLFYTLRPKRVLRYLKKGAPLSQFVIPKGWYLKPKELFKLMRFAARIGGLFLRTIR